MADEFDLSRAASEHRDLINRVTGIRDSLTREVIDYYYNDPTSEENAREKRTGMREYLRRAVREIDSLLDGPLR
jgi:hypothetical protein